MTTLFQPKKTETASDVKMIRNILLQFIKEQLSKAEGGEGGNIKGLQLFITCADGDKHLYDAALYLSEDDRFKKEEVQRIADDFAINLPANWTMEFTFSNELPQGAVKVPDLDAGLFIRTQKRTLIKSATAYVTILNGEAEKETYTILSTDARVNIGREKTAQSEDGFFRVNHIAFPGNSQNESNKFISRQHAHIRFNNDSGEFLLFADEGGIPPRNKIKVRSVGDEAPVKLYSTRIGHALQEGDQIMLGESALLEFHFVES